GQLHLGHALAVELHELAHHAVLAQLLGDGEYHVGGGHAGGDLALELEAHHRRDQHGDRLAEHGGLGLDTAHAPAQHAQAVDHRGVRVGADQGVRVGAQHSAHLAGHDHACQVLDVDLVHDAGARGYHLEVVESGLAPAQELVPLVVALVLDLHIALEGVRAAEHVDLDRVVDHQFGWGLRVDAGGIAAQFGHRLTHGGQVHDAGHTG